MDDKKLDLPGLMDLLLFPEKEHPVEVENWSNEEKYCVNCAHLDSISPSFIEGYKVETAVDCGNHTWRLRDHDVLLSKRRNQISLLLTAIGFPVGYFSKGLDLCQDEKTGVITEFTFPAKGLTYHQLDRIAALFGTKRINWGQQDRWLVNTAAYDDIGIVEVLDPVLAAVG